MLAAVTTSPTARQVMLAVDTPTQAVPLDTHPTAVVVDTRPTVAVGAADSTVGAAVVASMAVVVVAADSTAVAVVVDTGNPLKCSTETAGEFASRFLLRTSHQSRRGRETKGAPSFVFRRVGSSSARFPTLCEERKGWGTRRFVAA
jgi:hypothetical protein